MCSITVKHGLLRTVTEYTHANNIRMTFNEGSHLPLQNFIAGQTGHCFMLYTAYIIIDTVLYQSYSIFQYNSSFYS